MSLNESEKEAVDRFVEGCRAHFGSRLRHTFLFGSKARGDDRPDSDIDILVVLRGNIREADRSHVSDIIYEVLETCGIYLHSVALSENEFERPKGQLRWLTSFVQEEGVELCDRPRERCGRFSEKG